DPHSQAAEVARRLGMTTTTLYAYVNGDGTVIETEQGLLNNAAGF
ncbi:MAG: transposon DNA-invertase, partial [Rhodobacteraceae bacterium]|nr:transposon DNA-invertase [Paracoccaceae bacterium]